MFRIIPHLSTEIRALLLGYFLCRGFYFATWPFVAIILVREFDFSVTKVGFLYCATGLLAALIGIYAGRITDVFGRTKTVLFGMLCYAGAFFCLGLLHNLWGIYLGVTFVALGKSIFEPQSRALISDRVHSPQDKEKVFYLLQYILNMAAAIGPLIFVYLGLDADLSAFTMTGVAFLLFTCVMTFMLSENQKKVVASKSSQVVVAGSKKTVLRDWSFLLFVASCFFMLMPYAQFESVFSVHLDVLFAGSGSKLFAKALGINAATILVCQPLFERLLRFRSVNYRLFIGSVPYFVSFWGFSLISPSNITMLYVSTIVFAIGEAILLPVLQVKVDLSAPKESKGAYFSVFHSAWLAFAFGPLVWGAVMDSVGGEQTLLLGLFLVLPTLACYLLSEISRQNKDYEKTVFVGR